MKEFKFGNVTVRIHGNAPSRETLEKACIKLVSKGVKYDTRNAK